MSTSSCFLPWTSFRNATLMTSRTHVPKPSVSGATQVLPFYPEPDLFPHVAKVCILPLRLLTVATQTKADCSSECRDESKTAMIALTALCFPEHQESTRNSPPSPHTVRKIPDPPTVATLSTSVVSFISSTHSAHSRSVCHARSFHHLQPPKKSLVKEEGGHVLLFNREYFFFG